MTRCPCGLLLGTGLCVVGHDATKPRRTKVHTVTRLATDRVRKVKRVAWPRDYRIGEAKGGNHV